jgi:hypothetical protein
MAVADFGGCKIGHFFAPLERIQYNLGVRGIPAKRESLWTESSTPVIVLQNNSENKARDMRAPPPPCARSPPPASKGFCRFS